MGLKFQAHEVELSCHLITSLFFSQLWFFKGEKLTRHIFADFWKGLKFAKMMAQQSMNVFFRMELSLFKVNWKIFNWLGPELKINLAQKITGFIVYFMDLREPSLGERVSWPREAMSEWVCEAIQACKDWRGLFKFAANIVSTLCFIHFYGGSIASIWKLASTHYLFLFTCVFLCLCPYQSIHSTVSLLKLTFALEYTFNCVQFYL